MGFRNPATTAKYVDTGGGTAGVRVKSNPGNPGAGVVQWYVGNATATAELDSSQTGSGGKSFIIGLDGGGPNLQLNTEQLPAGGYQRVARLTSYDAIHLDPIVAALSPTAGWARAAAGYGDPNVTLAEQPRVWIEADGTIHCVGAWVNTGSIIAALYEPWFNLPSGFAPPDDITRGVDIFFNTTTAPSRQRCDIGKDGRVALASTTSQGAGVVFAFDWTWRST